MTSNILQLNVWTERQQQTKTIYYVTLPQVDRTLKALSPFPLRAFIILCTYPFLSYVLHPSTASVTYIPSVHHH